MSDWFGLARARLEMIGADERSWQDLLELAWSGVEQMGAERFTAEGLPYLIHAAARWDEDERGEPWSSWSVDGARREMPPDHPTWGLVEVIWARTIRERGLRREALGRLRRVMAMWPADQGAGELGGALGATEMMWCLGIMERGSPRPTAPPWARRVLVKAPLGSRGFVRPVLGAQVERLDVVGALLNTAQVAELEQVGRGLRTLGLLECALEARAARALARLKLLGGLEGLELQGTRLGERGLEVLLESGALDGLGSLGLRRLNPLWDTGAAVLGAHGGFKGLHTLDVREDELTSAGAQALTGASWLRGLRVLDVRDNRIGPAGLEALRGALHPEARLLDAGNWGRLEGGDTLRVGCSSVSPALMREIVQVAASRDIRRLYIMPARLDMNALRVLLAAPLPGVERFGIKTSTIREGELGELEAWGGIRRLEALDLRGAVIPRGSWALDRLRHEARALEVLRVDGEGV